MSGKAPKQKGNRIERECVNLAKGFGFESRRAWGSDGRSLGWHEEVDMIIECDNGEFGNPFKFQVKGRKAIADYLKPCEYVYGQILKEDRHEPLVTIRYKDLLTLFKRLTG
jgi:Holliday junction resolvase